MCLEMIVSFCSQVQNNVYELVSDMSGRQGILEDRLANLDDRLNQLQDTVANLPDILKRSLQQHQETLDQRRSLTPNNNLHPDMAARQPPLTPLQHSALVPYTPILPPHCLTLTPHALTSRSSTLPTTASSFLSTSSPYPRTTAVLLHNTSKGSTDGPSTTASMTTASSGVTSSSPTYATSCPTNNISKQHSVDN